MSAAAPTRTDVVGLLACLPHELGRDPEPSTLVVVGLDESGRVVLSVTLPLVDALLLGGPDAVAQALRAGGATGGVVVAYHEATLQVVADIATHLALGLEYRGLDVVGVAQVGLATDGWRRMTGWVDDGDEDEPACGPYSELAQHPVLAALLGQDEGAAR